MTAMTRNSRKSNAYCSVPQCSNYISNTVSLHSFPRDEVLKKKWQIALKIGKPISKYMCVCSEHFLPSNYTQSTPNPQQKRLKKCAIPTQKIPVGSHPLSHTKLQRRSPKTLAVGKVNISMPLTSKSIMETNDAQEVDIINSSPVPQVSSCGSRYGSYGKHKSPLTHISLEEKTFADKAVQTEPYTFEFVHSLETDMKLKTFAGVEHNLLQCMQTCCENIATYNKYEEAKLKMKLLLVLIKLKLNISFGCLAILFNLSQTTCTSYFYHTLHLMAVALKPVIYWPTREEVRANLPKCFSKFTTTRAVLDCTEVSLQKLSCLKCRIHTYSHYKHDHTMKFLIGITPSGLISYVSPGYGGRSSDKAIVLKENFLMKCDPQDAIMVDKGFLIEQECEEMLIKLKRPPFLRKQKQLTKEDAEKTAEIARARVHVERAIQRIKTFKILNDKIHWYLIPVMDDVMNVVAALVNLSPSILADDKFEEEE